MAIRKLIIFTLLFVAFALTPRSTHAQLPSHLPPLPVVRLNDHPFYDRIAKVELGAAITLAVADIAQTCHNLSNGGHEDSLPTQSCAGVTAILAAQVIGQEFVALTLHKMGHHRLERAARFFSIEGNTQGLIYSKMHGAL